jgi:ubiquinone/menaquinone biosynthesis C-methylase UbiE
MPTEREVYDFHADRYEQLVYREDYQKNIPAVIKKIRDYSDLDIVECGAGTGRLTRFLAHSAKHVYACDISFHMLNHARNILQSEKMGRYSLQVADMRFCPFADNSADLFIAGWSFCYLAVWGGEYWKSDLETGLAEAMRMLRKGGIMILFENFGTGFDSPHPPPHLDGYFDFLKQKGFQSTWIRTDYQFASMDEALDLSGFFFGEELSAKVKNNRWTILPECTGVWWLEKK